MEKSTLQPRIALLSNTNMNFVIRMLQKDLTVYEAEGYGNELGTLMNPMSSYDAFDPEYTFLLIDLMEVIEHNLETASAEEKIADWFANLEAALKTDQIYYVSDAYLWGVELSVVWDSGRKQQLEQMWQHRLEQLCKTHSNVRIFPYRRLVEKLGEENTFSPKMWYMGKILLTQDAQKRLCEEIQHTVAVANSTPKKVLLLDLDNTLWGGLAGEADHTPVILSKDHSGLAYKNLQRVILQMQKQGVLLGIVSKNNEEDAKEILEHHSHMVLRPECFAIQKINWKPKHENIREIAEELNLGTDSFVFWDDNPTERQLVKDMLPEVTVPDFPDRPEELAPAMVNIYRQYFEKPVLTGEDWEKTKQYAANVRRNHLASAAHSFEDYLSQLEIVVTRVKPADHIERFTQLMNKTNQFNLTTQRYTQTQVQQLLESENHSVFFYRVEDRFGDNGLVAAAVVSCSGEVPTITDFVMSCRVMGKQIEQAILTDIESELWKMGYRKVQGLFIPTSKNKPVEKLYEQSGFQKTEGDAKPEEGVVFQRDLTEEPTQKPYITLHCEA